MAKIKYIYIITLILFSGTCVYSQSVQKAIDNFTANQCLNNASIGICILDIKSGNTIAGKNINISQIPASTLKTITSASALRLLGKDFRFHTKVYARGEINSNGTLKGDIVITGGGDPSLESAHITGYPSFLEECTKAIIDKGIKHIKGRIIINDTIFPLPATSPRWMTEDIGFDYGAGIHGLNFADNMFKLKIDLSGDSASIIETIPDNIAGLKIDNHIKLVNTGNESVVGEPILIRREGNGTLSLFGTMEKRNRPVTLYCSTPFPQKQLKDSLVSMLKENGIKISAKNYKSEKEQNLLLDYTSPELPVILKSLLIRSDNMYAESVLRAIALNASLPATPSDGIKCIKELWTESGINISPLFMYDGSGLARNNKVPALLLAQILAYMAPDKSTEFSSLLPRAGEEGTVKHLLAKSRYKGKFAVKSGSMGDVQCFAGYFPADKPEYAVVILVNNYSCGNSTLIKNIETLLINCFSRIQNF
jgi:D-alanyl-D-alanine carboxypeptidase/D-alanyl-D-alanine-endopeptidase